jgi:glucose/arabinose dehydrogenase
MHHRSSHALLITAVALLAGCGQSEGSNGVGSSEAPDSSWASSDAELSRLTLPTGFSIHLFAKDLEGPRMMAIGPDKALYVSEPRAGKVVRLVDVDRDGRADSTADAATGLNRPHGLAWLGDTLWVANTDAVVKTWSTKGDGKLDGVRTVVDGLPEGGRHWTKTIHFPPTKNGAEPQYFFLATGSSCNVCEEHDPLRATISRWTIDGKPAGAKSLMNTTAAKAMVHNGGKYADAVWAYGLRNSVDFGWEPSTGAMWAVHNGSDVLGKENQAITDSIPHEEVVNIIQEGGFYGWPYCYEDGQVSPLQEGATRALCQEQIAPALTDTAHSAPLGLAFYTGTQFPESYRGDEFITEHGSWNRSEPVGARVIHVNVENGKPQGLEAFITGWETADGKRWGRPVGIIVGPDGTMYVSDDAGGRIYAIRWTGAAD